MTTRAAMNLTPIGMGGGCHWCTEAVFESLKGVGRVEQGWISSVAPDDSFSEGVIVHFDPAAIRLSDLIEVHLHTHASQSDHSLRARYRSAVYAMDVARLAQADSILNDLAAGFVKPLVTRALPFRDFRPSRGTMTCYYSTDPSRPFCRDYIEPKIRLLRGRFPTLLKTHSAPSEKVLDPALPQEILPP